MTKAILVTNMPENCYLCGFCQEINGFSYCCGCNDTWYEHQVEDEETSTKPNWCPLKPMPERKKVGEIERVDDFMKSEIMVMVEKVEAQIRLDTELLLATGYNACLDEILGEE